MNANLNLVHDCLALSETIKSQSPLSEAFRPRQLNELLLPDVTCEKLQAMKNSDRIMNMIFSGRPGVGKTSCARLLAENRDTMTINASEKNSVDYIRSDVGGFSRSMSLFDKKKLVIFDEADFLSQSAQALLRAMIEEVYENCRFIFIVNDFQSIMSAIVSRCYRVSFDIPYDQLDQSIAKYKRLLATRLEERRLHVSEDRIGELVSLLFPDFRAIANAIEFELM